MLIGEVSALSGVSVRMLRHYDRTGLLSASTRTSTDYRDYTHRDLERLLRIEALRTLGLSLAQVRSALDGSDADASAILARVRTETQHRIQVEEELLAQLDNVGEATPTTWEEVLHITALLSAVNTGSSRQRQAAALRTTTSHPLTTLVEAYLREDDPNTVGALRWSLAQANGKIVPLLLAHSGDSAETDRRIIDALADNGSAEALEALCAFLGDPDTEGSDGGGDSEDAGSTEGASIGGEDAADAKGSGRPHLAGVSGHAALAIGKLITQRIRTTDATTTPKGPRTGTPHSTESLLPTVTSPAPLCELPQSAQRQLITSLISLIINGDHDVEAAEYLGRLSATDKTLTSQVVAELLAAGRCPRISKGSGSGESDDYTESGKTTKPSEINTGVSISTQLRVIQALGEIVGEPAQNALRGFTENQDQRIAMTARYLLNR